MKQKNQGVFSTLGKKLASPLCRLFVNPATENMAAQAEAYWCILLGKGAGTGWALSAEIKAAQSVILSDAPVIFDVGANKGEWALLLHNAFPRSQIYMFEPQPDCQKIIADKNIPNTHLFPFAVSSVHHVTKLFTPGNAAGIASLHERKDTFFAEKHFNTIDVETVPLDEIIEKHGIQHIDFLKMDIEGHELDALKGVEGSLKRGIVKALSFEFGSANINSRTYFRDFWDFLHPLDFRIYRILPSGRLMRIKRYYEDCEYFRGVSNYVAVHGN